MLRCLAKENSRIVMTPNESTLIRPYMQKTGIPDCGTEIFTCTRCVFYGFKHLQEIEYIDARRNGSSLAGLQ